MWKKLNLEKCYEILKFLYSRCLRSVLLLELNNAQSASEWFLSPFFLMRNIFLQYVPESRTVRRGEMIEKWLWSIKYEEFS